MNIKNFYLIFGLLFVLSACSVKTDLNSTALNDSLILKSTNAGGDNNFDSTKRLIFNSFQKAQSPNNFGEVMRIYSDSPNSKQMIAWYDRFTDPAKPKLMAWAGWHYAPNDSNDQINPHNHFSIETNDASNIIRTRFEIVASSSNVTQVNTTNANFTVVQGVSGVSGLNGVSKQFVSYLAGVGRNKTPRWSFGGNSSLEIGNNSGSDFQISRFNDAGSFIDSPLFISRSNGNVGIGTVSPGSTLHVEAKTKMSVITVGSIGKSAACLKMVNSDKKDYTYCTFLSGAMSCSTKDCSE